MTKWQCKGCGNTWEAEERSQECRCGCRVIKEAEIREAPSAPASVAEPAPARGSGDFPAWPIALLCGVSILIAGAAVWNSKKVKTALILQKDETQVAEGRAEQLKQELADAAANLAATKTLLSVSSNDVELLVQRLADASRQQSNANAAGKSLEAEAGRLKRELADAKAKQTAFESKADELRTKLNDAEAKQKHTAAQVRHLEERLAQPQPFTDAASYMVIDLSGGYSASQYPVRYTSTPPNLSDDKCRTKEMWLRLIKQGSFMMGSQSDETEYFDDQTFHRVTLTQPFYMGIFEVTQGQYDLVMGAGRNPSAFKGFITGATRPVESVSYNHLRGSNRGSQWPENYSVDDMSFFGQLRERTLVMADLPTEAQWEYAGRTTTGRLDFKDGLSEHGKVGLSAANDRELHDMCGNVSEWCLDWHGAYLGHSGMDPGGALSGDFRIHRGGSYKDGQFECNPAHRGKNSPNFNASTIGFRVVVLPIPFQ